MKKCINCGAIISNSETCCPECNKTLATLKKQRSYEDYYSDVLVEDVEKTKKRRIESTIALKIGLVVFVFVVSIATCVAAMCLI